MRNLSRVLLGATVSFISFGVTCNMFSLAQSDQGQPSNGSPGQPQDFQRPPGGPEGQDQGPPEGPLGGFRNGPGNHNQQSGAPSQWQGQGQSEQNSSGPPGQGNFGQGQRRPWDSEGQGQGQGQGGRGQWGGGQGMTPEQRAQRKQRMLQMFDKNGDGQLDENEKAQMHAFMQQRRQQRMQQQGQGGGGGFNNNQPGNNSNN